MSRALVLAGGGARAAYEVGVLAGVADRAPGLEFPIVTGVSAGAINAVHLAAHPGPLAAAVGALRAQWSRLVVERVYRIRPGRLARGLLLGAAHTALGRGGEAAAVRGLLDMSPTWQRALRYAVRSRLTLDHVMASAALPILFPAVRIGDGFYGDGSLRQTAPLAPAIHLGARAILAVTQRSDPERPPSPPPAPAPREYPALAEVIGLLLHAIFLDALEADAERLERVNRLVTALPEAQRPDGLRPVRLLMLRPSRNLGGLAAGCGVKLPPLVRWLVRGMGGQRATAVDFLSYLLFDPAYTNALIELGYDDVRAQWPLIERFLVATDAGEP